MAIREIKATLALDGEKKFSAVLNEAGRNLRVMDSGLKAVEASYKVSGDRSDYLAKRTSALGDQLEQQKRIVAALSTALQEAEGKYGSTGARTDGYRIKLNNALKKQAELEKALRDTTREMDDLGRESVSTGRQIDNGITDAAEDATRSLRDMYAELKNDIGSIRSSSAVSAITDIGGSVIDMAQGLDQFAESTRDYRRQMSFLEQNANDAGQDYEFIKTLLFETAALTGEVDGAVEGISNLLATGFDASEIVTAIDLLGGAVIAFPDTLKFESLADSLQETIATGQATGQYAELLERLGIDLDKFNEAMEEAVNAEEKQQVALSFLANNGLKATREEYEKNNEELVRAEQATLRLNDEMAELGGTAEKLVLIPVKTWLADQVEELNNFIEAMETLEGRRKSFQDDQPELSEALESGQLDTFGGTAEYVGDQFSSWWDSLWSGFHSGAEQNQDEYLKHLGVDAVESMQEGMEEAAPDASSSAKTIGSNAATEMGNGINEAAPGAINAAASLVASVNAQWAGLVAPSIDTSKLTAGLYDKAVSTSGGGSQSGAGSGGKTNAGTAVVLNMNSREVARGIISDVNNLMGQQNARAVTIG